MPSIKIVVRTKEDKGLALPDIVGDTVEATLVSFVILEGGMQSGKSSVALHIKLPDGTDAIAETSADIFRSMAGALKGAEERFAELRSQNPNQTNIHDAIRDAGSDGV